MKTVIAFIAIALATAFALTGCMSNGDTYSNQDSTFVEINYKHSDGTLMRCLRYDRGITCDWSNNPKTEGTPKK